jgi:6-phosphogluconolactonase
VTAFAVDPDTGGITLLNRQSSCGVSPPYVSVHPSGRYAFAANYASGHVCALPIHDDGTLGEATSVILHAGSGPVPNRQAGPHAHFITPDPTGRYVLACDLGIDKVMVYRFDPDDGKLAPNDPPFAALPPGSGPRHLAFHPGGGFVYVINEIASTLSAFAYDGAQGAMQLLQTISTLPEGFGESNSCAQIVAHPNGRFVYGSNRGHDSIASFAVDETTGRLTPIGHEPTRGKTPRNFNLDPSGAFLYAANQESDTIVVFRVDADTGRLTPTGDVIENPNPVCVIFRLDGM